MSSLSDDWDQTSPVGCPLLDWMLYISDCSIRKFRLTKMKSEAFRSPGCHWKNHRVMVALNSFASSFDLRHIRRPEVSSVRQRISHKYEFSHIYMNASKYEFSHVWILYWRANWIIRARTQAYKTGFRGASKHEVCVLSRADVGSIKLVALVWASTWLGSIRAVSLVWAWECTTWLAWMLLKGGTLRVPTKLTQSKKKTNQ